MDDFDRNAKDLARGIAMFHRVFGEAMGDEMIRGSYKSAGETFNKVISSKIGPEVWERDIIDMRTKLISVIAMFAVMGREEIKYFMRAALFHGVTRSEIEEILLLAGLQAGFPNCAAAFRRLAEAASDHADALARQPK